jgi:hypothetical protein
MSTILALGLHSDMTNCKASAKIVSQFYQNNVIQNAIKLSMIKKKKHLNISRQKKKERDNNC